MSSRAIVRRVLLPTLGITALPALLVAQDLPDLSVSRFELRNGLAVVLAPDSAATEASIELWLDFGTRDEPPGKFGLAHFYEHATPFGYGVGRTTAGRRLLDSLRTNSNARTRPDYTRYYQQTRAEGLDLFLRVFADRLAADPAVELTAAHTERHRANVAAEIARQAPGRFGWPVRYADLSGTFGVAHPYGHAGYGSDIETQAVTADDLVRWSRAHFRPELATLIVVGPMDTATTRRAIERHFGGIPGGARPARTAWAPTVATAITDTVMVPTDIHRVLLSWPGPSWDHADRAAMEIASRVLASRLVAAAPDWIAAVGADYDRREFGGHVQVRAELTAARDMARAERWLRSRVAELGRDGPTAAELDAARAGLRADLVEQLTRLGWAASRSELIGESVMFTGDPGAWRSHANRALAVTAGDVQAVVWQWLDSPGFALHAVGAM